jgi:AraC-like DNA-binding protein
MGRRLLQGALHPRSDHRLCADVWTDHDGDLESVLTIDELLDNLMLHWLPVVGDVPGAAAASPLLRFHRTITGRAWPLERERALLAAVVAVAREFRLGNPPPDGGSWRGHRAVQLVRDYLHAYPAKVITLSDLAGAACMSTYHLARTFKAETGLAPHAYQIRLRVLQAKRLLAERRSIAATVTECAFCDQAHLTHQFKRHVGVTPGAYARGMTGLTY